MNTFLLDGAYDTDRNTFAIAVYPPMDSVHEFHMQSSLAPAEFPQSGGGAIDVVTKSGTRNFHGSGFEYLRNEATDARNYFDDPGPDRPIFRQKRVRRLARRSRSASEEHLSSTASTKASGGRAAIRGLRSCPTSAPARRLHRAVHDLRSRSAARALSGQPHSRRTRIDPIATAYLTKYEPLPNSAGATSNYRDATPNQDVNRQRLRPSSTTSSAIAALLTGRYTLNREAQPAGRLVPGAARRRNRCARSRRRWATRGRPRHG